MATEVDHVNSRDWDKWSTWHTLEFSLSWSLGTHTHTHTVWPDVQLKSLMGYCQRNVRFFTSLWYLGKAVATCLTNWLSFLTLVPYPHGPYTHGHNILWERYMVVCNFVKVNTWNTLCKWEHCEIINLVYSRCRKKSLLGNLKLSGSLLGFEVERT